MPRKPSDIVQYKLRIRESLRRQIEKAAEKNKVSANQEMANRLERSFRDDQAAEMESMIASMRDIIAMAEATFAEIDKRKEGKKVGRRSEDDPKKDDPETK